ncbi:MAG: phosphoribosylglycinamide formyltransferase [Candidatus Kapabacteria bacterium]|nr:phosphoribosylglycinamide formyltransferase [Candidatus Kapabacteria bacterium]MDW7997049.1 phosphoribosylglycinamide formyltransferase [Bacteroidota bacterium]MDW8224595.1 phosphoribosylglycinamide formyltransferase [Bacteroidota bacterium]
MVPAANAKAPGPVRVAIFASGRGTNAEALIRFSYRPEALYQVVLILSNNSTAGVRQVAERYRIPFVHISSHTHPDPAEYADALLQQLRTHEVELIALAGYLKKVPPAVVQAYRGRIFNIHPALLPRFGGPGMYGLHVHEAVLHAGEPFTGVTVHIVDEDYDTGTVLAQLRIPVLPEDTPESLAERLLVYEHELYPRVLNQQARILRRC